MGDVRRGEPGAANGDHSANAPGTGSAYSDELGATNGDGREAVRSSTRLPTRGREEAAGSKDTTTDLKAG